MASLAGKQANQQTASRRRRERPGEGKCRRRRPSFSGAANRLHDNRRPAAPSRDQRRRRRTPLRELLVEHPAQAPTSVVLRPAPGTANGLASTPSTRAPARRHPPHNPRRRHRPRRRQEDDPGGDPLARRFMTPLANSPPPPPPPPPPQKIFSLPTLEPQGTTP